jgi:uncharacterized protein
MKTNRTASYAVWCIMIILFLVAGPAKAEVKPMDPAKIQDIKKLLELIRLEEVVMLGAESALERLFPILKKATAQNNQAVSETVFAILKTSTLSLVKRQISAKNGLMDRVVPLYDTHYTKDEIQSLIQFYETPLGKKVSALRPQIAKEGMVVAEEWINFLEPLLVQALARSLEKEGYTIVKKPAK